MVRRVGLALFALLVAHGAQADVIPRAPRCPRGSSAQRHNHGWICAPSPRCRADGTCRGDRVCESVPMCIERWREEQYGRACESDADCPEGRHCSEIERCPPRGACGRYCDAGYTRHQSVRGPCGADGSCPRGQSCDSTPRCVSR